MKHLETTESGRRRHDALQDLHGSQNQSGEAAELGGAGGSRAPPRASLLDPITLTEDEDVGSQKWTVGI